MKNKTMDTIQPGKKSEILALGVFLLELVTRKKIERANNSIIPMPICEMKEEFKKAKDEAKKTSGIISEILDYILVEN